MTSATRSPADPSARGMRSRRSTRLLRTVLAVGLASVAVGSSVLVAPAADGLTPGTRPAAARAAAGAANLASAAGGANAAPVAAVVPRPTVRLAATAQVVVGGAGVRIATTYSCPAGHQGNVSVQLTEVVTGRHIAQGFGGSRLPLTCDGKLHALPVTVTAGGGAYAFEAGDALAQADIAACPPKEDTCLFAIGDRTVRLVP